MKDTDFLEYILKGIVSFPDDVSVDRGVDEMGVMLTVSLHKEDMGKVIGKQGATAKAIRTILNSFGYNVNAKISMKILEPQLIN